MRAAFFRDRATRQAELGLFFLDLRRQFHWIAVLIALVPFGLLAFIPHVIAPNATVGLWLWQSVACGAAMLQGALLLSADGRRGTLELRLIEIGSPAALLRRRAVAALTLTCLLHLPGLIALAVWLENLPLVAVAFVGLIPTVLFAFALALRLALGLRGGLRALTLLLALGSLLFFGVGDRGSVLHPLATVASPEQSLVGYWVGRFLWGSAGLLLLGASARSLGRQLPEAD